MARVPVFTDAFPSSISASYDNGPGDWNTFTWSSSGVVRPSVTAAGCTIVRNTGTFSASQYGLITALALTGANYNAAAAGVYASGGANEECYYGEINTGGGVDPRYSIYEVDNAFGFTALASSGVGSGFASGVIVVLEVDSGGALRLYTDEGGGETLRLSASDATLTSGRPMATLYADVSTTETGLSYFEGGDLVSASTKTMLLMGAG